MASYRRRLERDLDGWIGRGLVPAASREAILADLGEARRLDAATTLAVLGALLAAAAAVAFVAANWSAIPRIARFGLILLVFLASAGGAAWASARERTVTTHALLAVAAIVFGAAIGLTGQIFDLTGDAQAALRGAGLAAALLALAGRSPWPAAVALLFIGLGDMSGSGWFEGAPRWPGWLVWAAPLGAATALAWRSTPLAHAAGIASIAAVLSLAQIAPRHPEALFLAAAAVLAVLALVARGLRDGREGVASPLYGWWTWGALIWFGAAGLGEAFRGVPHAVAWLALAAAVLVLGRHDRHAAVTGAGVVGLFAAGASLLFNLGVGLMTSAAVFAACAVAALIVALLLKRGRAA